MKKFGIFLIFLALIASLIYFLYPNATDIITKPSAREAYEREFQNTDQLFNKWKLLSEISKKDSLQVEIPFAESGLFSSEILKIFTFEVSLKRGEIFHAEVKTEIDSIQVFMELFEQKNDSVSTFISIQSNRPNKLNISEEIKETGIYKIHIQPEIFADSPFQLKIYTQPQYAFPVVGKDNRAIQSFWGADREGGKRSHKGNDIFAARGTPVVAITDGIVSSTGNRGLGGKQVWLRDGIFGQSLYYAHLDSIIARQGQRVKIGDTLGLVGNTGNARTTPPHLHFGIYTSGGAIDPYPFIKISEIPKDEKPLSSSYGVIKPQTSKLLQNPKRKSAVLQNLKRTDTISIFGKSGSYYHITSGDTLRGFILERDVKELFLN
ncbi:hypothetical protein ULMS_01640 [Patiriisocius marinistellae]|uniref:M23ase beta-sheet core domain-containing protein n=1 Tax=Patiriisocius marinistellae TaxID=2494560 RepID=A0A5J4FX09_9FLAO|nr:M23 family metallopeptidase [Patiriisocius marinistellae]GEQ84656.1 hypothetical protein ULMS_01640 [Patiriisocius marinistellae]